MLNVLYEYQILPTFICFQSTFFMLPKNDVTESHKMCARDNQSISLVITEIHSLFVDSIPKLSQAKLLCLGLILGYSPSKLRGT